MPTNNHRPVGPNITVDQMLAMLHYAHENPTATYEELAGALGVGTGAMLSHWNAKGKKQPKSGYGKIVRALKEVGYEGSRGSAQSERKLGETIDAAMAKYRSLCECGSAKDKVTDDACLVCLSADNAREDIMRQNNHSVKERNRILREVAGARK